MTAWAYLTVGDYSHSGTRHTTTESLTSNCRSLYVGKHPEESVEVWMDGSKYLFDGSEIVKYGTITELANALERCIE